MSSPHLRPARLDSAHTSNTHLCGIAIAEYRGKGGKTSLFVCHDCKGIIVQSIVMKLPDTGAEVARALTRLQTGMSNDKTTTIADDNDNRSRTAHDDTDYLWEACGLSVFPALRRYKRTWAKLARHIAKETALNLAMSPGAEAEAVMDAKAQAVAAWDMYPDKAYQWWKANNEARAVARKSAAATALNEENKEDRDKSPQGKGTHDEAGLERANVLLDELMHLEDDLHEAVLAGIALDKEAKEAEVEYWDAIREGGGITDARARSNDMRVRQAAADQAAVESSAATKRTRLLRGRIEKIRNDLEHVSTQLPPL